MNNADLIFRAKNYPKQRSLGQNFLVDSGILDSIVEISDLEDQVLVEIGPGAGFLTERLVKYARKIYAVELDANAETALKIIKSNNDNFDYIRGDFLSLNISDIVPAEDLEKKVKIVANIPYQISTKILLHLLGEMAQESPNRKYISEINILVQKEFAERLCAVPGTKAYGAITLLIRYWAEVEYCLDVPKECFMPSPKVDSAFIKIRLRDKPLVNVAQPKELRRLIKAIFANRRKKLLNGLRAAGYSDEQIAKLNLAENQRGETLTLEDMASYCNLLSEFDPVGEQ